MLLLLLRRVVSQTHLLLAVVEPQALAARPAQLVLLARLESAPTTAAQAVAVAVPLLALPAVLAGQVGLRAAAAVLAVVARPWAGQAVLAASATCKSSRSSKGNHAIHHHRR